MLWWYNVSTSRLNINWYPIANNQRIWREVVTYLLPELLVQTTCSSNLTLPSNYNKLLNVNVADQHQELAKCFLINASILSWWKTFHKQQQIVTKACLDNRIKHLHKLSLQLARFLPRILVRLWKVSRTFVGEVNSLSLVNTLSFQPGK